MDNQNILTPSSTDAEIESILKEMLDQDQEITARAVIRRHSSLKAASSITRNNERAALLANYQEKQTELRNWQKRVGKKSKDNVVKDLAECDARIAELERQVELLTASHVAMIRVVGELGGFSKWARFFEDYQGIRQQLEKLGAI